MKILLAEDNHFFRRALTNTLSNWGFEVIEACDGEKAWRILREPNTPKLAIIDWMMPCMSGIELCRRVRSLRHPEPTYIIMLTCLNGSDNLVEALEAGADDFIHKPFVRDQLLARLRVGKRIVGLQTSQTVVFTFARAVEAKSPFTQGHADRVTYFSLAVADALGLSDDDKDTLRRGALLHDVGKISVPDEILNKPGSLTPDERDIIRTHHVVGYEMAKPLESLEDTLPLIRSHHERLDGSGYPDGLQGGEISLLVRILSVADMYDALASSRPYRSPVPHEACLAILHQDADEGRLDPVVVDAFSSLSVETFATANVRPLASIA